MEVGTGCTSLDLCDGQTACIARLLVGGRSRHPVDPIWAGMSRKYMSFSQIDGTTFLLTSLAFGNWKNPVSLRA